MKEARMVGAAAGMNPQSFNNIPPGLANSHAVSTVTVLQKVTVQNRVDSKRP